MNLNRAQRAGLFVTGTTIIAILFIHNPTEGYTTNDLVSLPPITTAPLSDFCREQVKISIMDVRGSNDLEAYMECQREQDKRYPRSEYVDRAIFDWISDGAYIPALSSLKSLLMLCAAVIVIGTFHHILYRTKPEA